MSTNGVVIRADEGELAGKVMALPAIQGLQVIIDLGVPLTLGKNSLKDWTKQVQMALQSLETHGWSRTTFELTGNRLSCFLDKSALSSAGHSLWTAFCTLYWMASDKVDNSVTAHLLPHLVDTHPSFDHIRISAVWHEEAYRISLQSEGKNLVGPDMDLAEELLHVCGQKELVIDGVLHDRLMAEVSHEADELEAVQNALGPCEKLTVGRREHSYYRTH